ncbi:MAG: 4'-phosphopantetheinyl transferase superfamily protein [Elusimicrobiota bacterium]|jgi:phosphopantetheinyl transferase
MSLTERVGPCRLLRLSPEEAARWAERYEGGEDLSEQLGAAELAQLAAFKVPKRRKDWLSGRLAAKRLVCALLAEKGRSDRLCEVAILNRRDGSPYAALPGDPEAGAPFLSISHGPGGAVAAAAPANGRVGVDVERVAERPQSFLTIFAHPSERPALDTPQAQTRLWTLKEAVLKLLTLGLSVDLWDVRFVPDLQLAPASDPAPASRGAAGASRVEPPSASQSASGAMRKENCPRLDDLRLELHNRARARWEALGSPEIRFETLLRGEETLSIAYTSTEGRP